MGLGTRFGARGRRRAKAWGEGCGQGRCRGPGAGKGWGFDVARTATERGKCLQARLAPPPGASCTASLGWANMTPTAWCRVGWRWRVDTVNTYIHVGRRVTSPPRRPICGNGGGVERGGQR